MEEAFDDISPAVDNQYEYDCGDEPEDEDSQEAGDDQEEFDDVDEEDEEEEKSAKVSLTVTDKIKPL